MTVLALMAPPGVGCINCCGAVAVEVQPLLVFVSGADYETECSQLISQQGVTPDRVTGSDGNKLATIRQLEHASVCNADLRRHNMRSRRHAT